LSVSDSDPDELRLALVLNGGVSLAIWISGVVAEIDALRRCDGPVTATAGDGDSSLGIYRALAGALGVRVRVDVIAGTSAGGLNGGMLGAAVAAGEPYANVRQLWMELGDLGGLLQTAKHQRSLLLGEQMLYGKLRDRLVPTLRDAATKGDDPEEDGRRVRVILTGTDIAGVTRDTLDSFGGTLKITDHRLHARFAYGGDAGGTDTPGGWAAMLPDGPAERTAMAEAVARAARTSASFPIAFESSELLLAGEADAASNSALGDALTTRDGHNVADVMRGEHRAAPLRRWAMDGGVLDNSPITAVLETMTGLSAERPVQRAVLFVVPYTDDPARDPDPEPGFSEVLGTVLNMPRDVGFTDHLEEVERDLARRAGDRTTYDRLLGLPAGVLQPLAESMYPAFWQLRAVTSVWSLLQAYRTVLAEPPQAGVALPGQQLAGRLAKLAEDAQVRWLPAKKAPVASLWSGVADDASEWRFGGAPPERIALRIADWLMGAREVLPEDASDQRDDLARRQGALHTAIRTFRASEQERRAAEGQAVAGARAATANGTLAQIDLVRLSSGTWTSDRQIAARTLLDAVAQTLVDVQLLGLPAPASGFLSIEGVDRNTSKADVARRLLMADVAWRALRGELDDEHQASNRYEFLRLNAAAPPPFQLRTDTEHWKRANGDPQQKLFGLQLGHFAGFVRSSWRANDFLWGRLDGAARLVDLLLAPSRLQRSPVAYETMEAIPGLRLPLPEKKGTFLDPADHGELEAWRACLQDSLALGILGTELENVSISMGSDTDEHEFSPEGDLVAALRAGDLETRFAAYARALAESAPDTIKTRVMDERNSDGGARLAVRTLDVGVSYLEAEGGPLKLAGRLLDAPVHVIGGLVAVRAEAHRIWRVIREHMPSNDSTTP
jgi:predicted acylesterase/phospholipase RssA